MHRRHHMADLLREQHVTFDNEAYRAWSAQATVWLDDEPDDRGNGPHVCTFALRLHQNSGESVNEYAGRNDGDSSIGEIYTDIYTDQMGYLHHLPGTESPVAGVSTSSLGVCEIRAGANILGIRKEGRPIKEQPASQSFSRCKVGCKGVQTSVNVQTNTPVDPADSIALPVAKDEPCHICSRHPP
jgi:hypothetical protein